MAVKIKIDLGSSSAGQMYMSDKVTPSLATLAHAKIIAYNIAAHFAERGMEIEKITIVPYTYQDGGVELLWEVDPCFPMCLAVCPVDFGCFEYSGASYDDVDALRPTQDYNRLVKWLVEQFDKYSEARLWR